jgi:putative transposase
MSPCRVLGVSESGFYEQHKRPPSERAIRHAMLTDLITQIQAEFNGTYGIARVHAELTLDRGVAVGHNQVELLMRRAGLQCVTGRRKRKWIKHDNIAIDLVQRDFTRHGPNQLWVTDITEHPTREGKIYCCVVLDTYSRRVVGWSIDSSPTAALVTKALGMAIDARLAKSTDPGTIIHSDQGVLSGLIQAYAGELAVLHDSRPDCMAATHRLLAHSVRSAARTPGHLANLTERETALA